MVIKLELDLLVKGIEQLVLNSGRQLGVRGCDFAEELDARRLARVGSERVGRAALRRQECRAPKTSR